MNDAVDATIEQRFRAWLADLQRSDGPMERQFAAHIAALEAQVMAADGLAKAGYWLKEYALLHAETHKSPIIKGWNAALAAYRAAKDANHV